MLQRILNLRLLTALALTIGSAFIAAKGWQIASFSIAENTALRQNNPYIFHRWITVPGLAFPARSGQLTPLQTDVANLLSKRRDELTEILSVRPLASEYWLSMLIARLALGEPPEKIGAAFLMSAVTGPNEGYLMLRRAIIDLDLWETLPTEARTQTAIDILGAPLSELAPLPQARKTDIKTLLAAKPEEIRQEIRAVLVQQGVSSSRLREIGLPSDEPRSGS